MPEDAYFASGLTEEITSRLTGTRGAAASSRRASVGEYRDSDRPLREVGRELGVDYVLEGSVRWDTAGGTAKARVIPSLIRVSDESRLWSERYDTRFADLFEMQAEIAEGVARALNVAIGVPERQALARRPTENAEAYAYYLRGTDYMVGSWGEVQRLRIAREMFDRAIALDSGFALAFARLSEAALDALRLDHRRRRGELQQARLGGGARRAASGPTWPRRTSRWATTTCVPQGVRRGLARARGGATGSSPTVARWPRRWVWCSGGAGG